MIADRVRMCSNVNIDFKDTSKAPGNKELIAGDGNAGYFGEVPSSRLISGTSLANVMGLTSGYAQFSDTGWLKFAFNRKIIFIAKKPFRYGLNWDSINKCGAVDGSNTIEINSQEYIIRLPRGANKNSPNGSSAGQNCHYSEWNKLMLPIHKNSKNKKWVMPNNVEPDIDDWDINFTDMDLHTHYDYGRGTHCWCQEIASTSGVNYNILQRGGWGVSVSLMNDYNMSRWLEDMGWRPVLEVIL